MGGSITLQAKALGTPRPSFHWYHEGQEVFVKENITITEPSIHQTEVSFLMIDMDEFLLLFSIMHQKDYEISYYYLRSLGSNIIAWFEYSGIKF